MAGLMVFVEKLKSFWFSGPAWQKWAKRIVAVLVLWPLVMTLVYSVVPIPISNIMIGRLLGGQSLSKQWMPLSKISPELARAVIASEDERFCQHWGIDWLEMRNSFGGKSKPSRGASTISMQVAKNVYLWEGRNPIRKVLELPLATYMDLVWTKRRMLEVYLNIAEWGPGIFGAEAAAQAHFKKSAAKLTRKEAALLAASLPNPIKRVAGKPNGKTRMIANRIQLKMLGIKPYLSCL